jgi:hypothetical protein
MGADLLQTFSSHRVQLLHQRASIIRMYPRLGGPDRSFFEELGDV